MSEHGDDAPVPSASQTKSLIHTRGGHKAYATQIMNQSKELMLKVAEGEEKLQLIEDLTANMEILDEKMEVITRLDNVILEVTTDANIENEIVNASAYKRDIMKTQIAIRSWIKRNAVEPDVPFGMDHGAIPRFDTRNQIKLPKIILPKFNGDPLSYQSFWDCFDSAVHKNASLDDTAKFNYLKGQLEGKARLAIQGLTLTSEN